MLRAGLFLLSAERSVRQGTKLEHSYTYRAEACPWAGSGLADPSVETALDQGRHLALLGYLADVDTWQCTLR